MKALLATILLLTACSSVAAPVVAPPPPVVDAVPAVQPTNMCEAYQMDTERETHLSQGEARARGRMVQQGYVINAQTEPCWTAFEKEVRALLNQYCSTVPVDALTYFTQLDVAGYKAQACYDAALQARP